MGDCALGLACAILRPTGRRVQRSCFGRVRQEQVFLARRHAIQQGIRFSPTRDATPRLSARVSFRHHCGLRGNVPWPMLSTLTGPPTIYPAVTPEEGEAIKAAQLNLQRERQDAASGHFREAAKHLAEGKWRDSVRESITAVESVAKSLGTEGTTLGSVLKKLDQRWRIHPALHGALSKLYGWTSDEDNVRHGAGTVDGGTEVDREEAVFMIGVCASFCSYLLGKQRKLAESRQPESES